MIRTSISQHSTTHPNAKGRRISRPCFQQAAQRAFRQHGIVAVELHDRRLNFADIADLQRIGRKIGLPISKDE